MTSPSPVRTGTAEIPARPRRRSLSLRARLLAGLIALTACFLIVMGVVSSVVLGRLEQNQFSTSLRLTATQPVARIATGADGFAAAYLSLRTGATGDLTPSTPTADQLRAALTALSGDTTAQLRQALTAHAAQYQPFTLNPGSLTPASPSPGSGTATASEVPSVPLRAAWRSAIGSVAGSAGLPAGRSIILIGRPVSAIDSQVSGLVTAELITGAALLALLALTGSWLIARGLAPLDRMAYTADLISGSGDLTARMPGGGRHETGRLAAAINTMLDRIQQAFRARLASEQKVRQFAADASHELRTPLTTIKGYAELYRQGALGPDDLPNAMRRIEQESDRMSMLVGDLLELARLDRGSSLDLTETDLAALARDAVADARAVEPDRPVIADVPPSLVVTADERRIRQVLANLLGNVRAHTPPGTPAAVRVYPQQGGAAIEVADKGPGLPEQDAALAFNRFYRGARGAGHAGGSDTHGSGLGLSIVEAIARAHGGSARLRSAPGLGTSVELWIPYTERPIRDQPADGRLRACRRRCTTVRCRSGTGPCRGSCCSGRGRPLVRVQGRHRDRRQGRRRADHGERPRARSGPGLHPVHQRRERVVGDLWRPAAETVVLGGDHVQPGERLARGEAACIFHYRRVIRHRAERRDRRARPPLVHDDLAAPLSSSCCYQLWPGTRSTPGLKSQVRGPSM